jgi:Asp-tRNA(Asn)/Glu-tRNA(Gln) amidotransferase A subunit family amidase
MAKPFSGVAVDPEVEAVLHEAVRTLARLGHRVIEAVPPIDFPTLNDANLAVVAASTRAEIEAVERRPEKPDIALLEPITAMWHHIGGKLTAADLQTALTTIASAGRTMDLFFEDHDILLTPTLATQPVEIGTLRLDQSSESFSQAFGRFCPFASLANLTGTPAITLPLGFSTDRLPIGIMAQGRYGQDHLLLQLATELETTTPWAHHRPPPLG